MRTIGYLLLSGFVLGGCALEQGRDVDLAGATVDGVIGVEDERPAAAEPCSAGVWSGDYEIENQADLDALEGYTEVTGSIFFDHDADDITEISGLSCLVTVGGGIHIFGTPQMVTGLQNLRDVGGSLTFADDDHFFAPTFTASSSGSFNELRSVGGLSITADRRAGVMIVDGFDNLRTVHGNLTFSGGDFRIFGFSDLEEVTGTLRGSDTGTPDDIEIYGMRDLSRVGRLSFEGVGRVVLDGLVDLELVDGDVEFLYTGELVLSGLTELERVNGDFVLDTAGPVDTTPLEDLTLIEGGLLIYDGPEDETSQMSTVEFVELEVLGGDLVVDGFNSPLTLGAFPELESIGGSFVIEEPDDLGDIVGFDELEYIGGDLYFEELTGERLVGFTDLEIIGGDLTLKEIEDLTEFDAFDDLEEVGGHLVFDELLVTSLSGFGDLASIGGDLILTENSLLESLGLDELTQLGGESLRIRDNPSLSSCAAEALAAHLSANGFSGAVFIEDNAPCE